MDMHETLAQARAAVADLQVLPAWALTDSESVAMIDTAQQLITELTALAAAHVHELDARGYPRAQGATSTGVWLRDRFRISIHSARRLLALGNQMIDRPFLRDAVASGDINSEQAAVIDEALADLPTDVGPAVVAECEAALIDQARTWEPATLRTIAEHILAHVAPDLADDALRRKLERDEEQAHRLRGFTMTNQGHGVVRISGSIDAESAAIVRAAIDPLCRPAPTAWPTSAESAGRWSAAAARDAAAAHSPAAAHGALAAHGAVASSAGAAGLRNGSGGDEATRDLRLPAQRRADALVDICRLALATTTLPDNGGDRPQITLTLDFDTLTKQVIGGTLDTGEPLTPSALRRLACDAAIIPAVLGSYSEVLDLGRSRRLFTGPIRRALVLRDRGCAFAGCDRPPRWTDGHHVISWLDGGPTDVSNGVLLCRRHHRAVHHDGWQVRLAGDGIPEFVPPPYVDPLQRPRRNQFHRRC